ncbi:pentapeptide repeat-containing protein [Micromonospora sp. NPDC003197]
MAAPTPVREDYISVQSTAESAVLAAWQEIRTLAGEHHPPPADRDRLGLRADCANCFGLCCVALPFAASADFAVDKAAGKPCTNLRDDFRCGIHSQLRERGFTGCTVFDCLGAGQKVSQVTFQGRSWRQDPDNARQMFDVFATMRQLHELLWYLTEALQLPSARPVHREVRRALDDVERLTHADAQILATVDVAAVRQDVSDLLLRASELARAKVPGRKKNHRGADLIGARLHGANLRGANLRGAYLIAANLRDADLREADVVGADFRDADLSGADLTGSLFLTQQQLNAARGSAATKLPATLRRPRHW